MSSTRVTAPRVYTHASNADWGRAVVTAVAVDRTTYLFEHAGKRTFLNANNSIRELPLPPEERSALAKRLLGRRSPVTKKPTSKRKTAAPPSLTLDRQLEAFGAAFPRGFEDSAFVVEERGLGQPAERARDAGIAFARETLSAKALDAAIERGAYAEVFADALRVLTAMQSLALPKHHRPAFERLAPPAQERFARALRDLLHGDGPYAARFDAFVAAAGTPPWTIATLFSAAVHPEAHVFVKPTLSQRQAKALGRAEPPLDGPTGAGYAQHLAVAVALRDKLVGAGMCPRDLFDVYSFGWRTLRRSAQASAR